MLRRWVSIVALLGVLLHAGAIVRHNAAMLGAQLEHQALLAGLSRICHGMGAAGESQPVDLPAIPAPTERPNGCPICSGMASAFALAGPDTILLEPPYQAVLTVGERVVTIPRTFVLVRPPTRGPPSALA